MADFQQALIHTLEAEGGYSLDPDDPGGETYRGIARASNGDWDGWGIIDAVKHEPDFIAQLDTNAELQQAIARRYRENYWQPIRADEIDNQRCAAAIFDFAVNAGPGTSAKLAQEAAGAAVDGHIGPKTLAKLNAAEPEQFLSLFTLAKVRYYHAICQRRPSSKKYFYGWVTRALQGLDVTELEK